MEDPIPPLAGDAMRLLRMRGLSFPSEALGFGQLYYCYKLLAPLTHMPHIQMGAVRTAKHDRHCLCRSLIKYNHYFFTVVHETKEGSAPPNKEEKYKKTYPWAIPPTELRLIKIG